MFLKHLRTHGCELLREGSHHSWYESRETRAISTAPRHDGIEPITACANGKQFGVPSF